VPFGSKPVIQSNAFTILFLASVKNPFTSALILAAGIYLGTS
jgi:hypothetical protein